MARNGMNPAKMHQAEIVLMLIRTLLKSQKVLHKEWVEAAKQPNGAIPPIDHPNDKDPSSGPQSCKNKNAARGGHPAILQSRTSCEEIMRAGRVAGAGSVRAAPERRARGQRTQRPAARAG